MSDRRGIPGRRLSRQARVILGVLAADDGQVPVRRILECVRGARHDVARRSRQSLAHAAAPDVSDAA